METCTYGLGADIWKPTTERWQGAEYRAYWYNGTPSSVFAAFADNRLGVLFGGLHLNSVSDVSYAALVSCSPARRPARWTAFAVWMPKKMYRISVFFFLALILRMA